MNTHNPRHPEHPLCDLDITITGLVDHDLPELYASDPDNPDYAYDILASWARLKRCNPEVVRTHFKEIEHDLNAIVTRDKATLTHLAAGVPDVEGWMDVAGQVVQTSKDLNFKSFDLEWQLYGHLVEQLDDAELVAWALDDLDYPDSEFDLTPCFDFIREHISFFIGSAGFSRMIVETAHPELVEIDPCLALTLEKFDWILVEDAIAREELAFDGLDPLRAQDIKALVSESDAPIGDLWQKIKRKFEGLADAIKTAVLWQPEFPAFEPVMASGTSSQPRESIRLHWEGLEKTWEALGVYNPSDVSKTMAVSILTDLNLAYAVIGTRRIKLRNKEEYYRFRVNLNEALREFRQDIPLLVLETVEGEYLFGVIKT